MNIKREELKDRCIAVAQVEFGDRLFRRRELISAVESHLKNAGIWATGDDSSSGPKSAKSKGYVNVDFAITDLKSEGRLLHLRRNRWAVATPPFVRADDRRPVVGARDGRNGCQPQQGGNWGCLILLALICLSIVLVVQNLQEDHPSPSTQAPSLPQVQPAPIADPAIEEQPQPRSTAASHDDHSEQPSPDWTARQRLWKERYLLAFRPLHREQQVNIKLTHGLTLAGKIETVTAQSVSLRLDSGATIELEKTQIAPEQRALLFGEDYAELHAGQKLSEEREVWTRTKELPQ